MEKVRTLPRTLLTLFMAVILLFSTLTPAYAASNGTYKTIVSNKHGTIYLGERTKRTFTLEATSKVKISFLGLDFKKDIGTYGRYLITIKNANKEVVYTKTGDSGYDNKKHITPELPAGKYFFILEVPEAEGFSVYLDELQYCYTLSYMVTEKVKINKVSITPASLTLKKGGNKTLTAAINPSYATSEITWSSSNNKIATVTKKGKVTAKALGTAKITAKVGGKKATCKVKVESTSVVAVKKRYTSLSSYVKNIANYKTATWKSSNTGIATVDKTGKVYGKAYGNCDIYCTVKGVKYTFKLSVKPAVSVGYAYLDDVAIYNDVGLKFKNNTNLDVTYLTLQIYQYDNRGVRLSSPYDYYYVNDTIKANSSDTFEFYVNDNTKKVKYAITKVWFSNGTTWTP